MEPRVDALELDVFRYNTYYVSILKVETWLSSVLDSEVKSVLGIWASRRRTILLPNRVYFSSASVQ